jgi:aryl-alcohol dehydrogenase-like predicted oxidoreductase
VQREIEAETIPLCLKEEIGVLSFSPLGAGFLTGKYSKGGGIPAGTRFDIMPAHQDVYFSDENFAIVETLRSQATASGISMAQLALAWVLNRPGITSVLIGARNTDQVDQAFTAENLSRQSEIQTVLTKL